TIAQLTNIDAANGSGTLTYTSVSDTADNLDADAQTHAGAGTFVTDHDVVITDAATIAQLTNIDAANGSGSLTYASISDTADNLEANAGGYVHAAVDITVTDTTSMAQLVILDTMTTGNMTPTSIADTLANLTDNVGGHVSGAVDVTVTDTTTLEQLASLGTMTTGSITATTIADLATNLAHHAGGYLDGAVHVVVTDAASIAQLDAIHALTSGAVDVLEIVDGATLLADNTAGYVNGSVRVTVTDTPSLAQLTAIEGYTTGTLTYGDTLILDADYTNPSSLPLNMLDRAYTIQGAGGNTFTQATGTTLALDDDTFDTGVTLSNEGTIQIQRSAGTVSINGSFLNQAASLLSIGMGGTNVDDASASFASDLINNGIIKLDNDSTATPHGAALTIASGTLTNNGTLWSLDTNSSGGSRSVTGSVTNTGHILLDHDLTIDNTNATLDTSSGTIDLSYSTGTVGLTPSDPGHTLIVNSGTTQLGSGTSLLGNGVLLLAGSSVELTGDFNDQTPAVLKMFDGTVTDPTGTSSFTIAAGSKLILGNETFAAGTTLTNSGTLQINRHPGQVAIDGSFSNNPLAYLIVGGGTGTALGDASVIFATGFINAGIVKLDHSGDTTENANLTITSGVLENTGTLMATDSVGTPGGTLTLTGSITNAHLIQADHDLTIENSGATFDTSQGVIDTSPSFVPGNSMTSVGHTLTINSGTTQFGTGTVLLGWGSVALAGTQTLELTGNYNHTTPVNLDFLQGTVTVQGSGYAFTNAPTSILNLDDDTFAAGLTLSNDGVIHVQRAPGTVTIDGDFQNHALGHLAVGVGGTTTNNATVTFANGFDNSGTISLDNDSGGSVDATLAVTSGILTNSGTILSKSSGTGGGLRTLAGSVTNTGHILADHDLTIDNTGGLFDTSSGTIDTSSNGVNAASGLPQGYTLTVNAGTTRFGSGTTVIGSGTVELLNGTLELAGTGTYQSTALLSLVNGAITSLTTPFAFTNYAGSIIDLNNVTIDSNIDLTNQGNLIFTGAANQVDGMLSTFGGSTLTVDGRNGTATNLSLAHDLTNTGTIVFDNSGTLNSAVTLDLNAGTLTNSWIIRVENSGSATANSYRIDGHLANHSYVGLVGSNLTLEVSNLSGLFTNDCTIEVLPGNTLKVAGLSGTQFINQNTGIIMGSGTIDVTDTDVTFVNHGTIDPGTHGTATNSSGSLTINGPVAFGPNGKLVIDLNNSLSIDHLTTGNLDLSGNYDILDLNFRESFFPTQGQTFSVVTAPSVTGIFNSIIPANLGPGWIFTENRVGNDVQVTAGKIIAAVPFAMSTLNSASNAAGIKGTLFQGIAANDYSGKAVGTVGDINGDGFDDLIVTAYENSTAASHAGAAYILFGGSASLTSPMSLSSITNGFTLLGHAAEDRFGTSAAPAGDINGDGIDDFIIGAKGIDDTTNSLFVPGRAYVIFGKTTGLPASSASVDVTTLMDGANGFQLIGGTSSDHMGISVHGSGDINGDGYADIVVGAYGVNSDAGRAYVVFGHGGTFASTLDVSAAGALNGTNGFVINGPTTSRAGYSVQFAGDVNGDGFDDLLIGTFGINHANSPGLAFLVYGNGAGFSPSLNLASLTAAQGLEIQGSNGDDLGLAVSTAGDINGDGYADILVGARGTSDAYVIFGSSTLSTSASINVASLNGSNGFALHGITAVDETGFSVAGVGDIDGDGFDDIMIGAYAASPGGLATAGQMHVVFGSSHIGSDAGNSGFNLSSLNGHNGFTINGNLGGNNTPTPPIPGDWAGHAVAAAGDFNGDGFMDLIGSALMASPGGTPHAGSSALVYGDNFAGKINYLGNANNNFITGSSANEILVGGAGGDFLDGKGGNDILVGGSGDDVLFYYPNITSVNGGSGTNTLLFYGTGESLNLHVGPSVKGIHVIDLNAELGADSLALNMSDVLKVSDHSTLIVRGGTADTVTVNTLEGWSKATNTSVVVDNQSLAVDADGRAIFDTSTFDVYTAPANHLGVLLIEDPIHRVGVT
ncbi:MAG: FG-GAP repeat protein, partial [Magnetococcales bacterium]|nr:FG-GAP repeat protein [Magnetococcales bacterium]